MAIKLKIGDKVKYNRDVLAVKSTGSLIIPKDEVGIIKSITAGRHSAIIWVYCPKYDVVSGLLIKDLILIQSKNNHHPLTKIFI